MKSFEIQLQRRFGSISESTIRPSCQQIFASVRLVTQLVVRERCRPPSASGCGVALSPRGARNAPVTNVPHTIIFKAPDLERTR
jgi:hypothetical protein